MNFLASLVVATSFFNMMPNMHPGNMPEMNVNAGGTILGEEPNNGTRYFDGKRIWVTRLPENQVLLSVLFKVPTCKNKLTGHIEAKYAQSNGYHSSIMIPVETTQFAEFPEMEVGKTVTLEPGAASDFITGTYRSHKFEDGQRAYVKLVSHLYCS